METKKQIMEKLMEAHPYIKKSGLVHQSKEELKEFLDYTQKMGKQGRNK